MFHNLPVKVFFFLFWAGALFAQDPITASPAELTIPFGVVHGQLVTVGDHVVFVNTERPDTSFAIRKSNITGAELEGGVVAITTKESISGVNRFVFQLDNPAKVAALVAWARTAPVPALTDAQSVDSRSARVIGEYRVRHDHRFRGGCDGKLVITRERASFESVSEIGHSRQWDVSDIKELRRPNPYKLELRPFVGGSYEFEIVGGDSMSSRDYKTLADMIANSRVPR